MEKLVITPCEKEYKVVIALDGREYEFTSQIENFEANMLIGRLIEIAYELRGQTLADEELAEEREGRSWGEDNEIIY